MVDFAKIIEENKRQEEFAKTKVKPCCPFCYSNDAVYTHTAPANHHDEFECWYHCNGCRKEFGYVIDKQLTEG